MSDADSSTPAPAVSVVVPVRNAPAGLGRLLAALDDQELGDFEVIVVDDASDDDTTRAVPDRSGVRVLRLDAQGGSYVARNAGVAAARGEVLAFTDADCRPRPDWLTRGLAALDEHAAQLVAGRVEMRLSARPTLAEAIDVARGLDQRRYVSQGFGATANLLVRRNVLEVVGPFNHALRSGGDAEFCRRALAAGFGLAYAPDAVVEHEPRRDARALARKAFRVGYGTGQVRRSGSGPSAARPRLWTQPGQWRPRRTLLGMERLEAQGYAPSLGRRVALDAAQYAYHQLPLVTGSLVESVTRGRRGIPRS